MKKYLPVQLLPAVFIFLLCCTTKNACSQTRDELLKVCDSATIHSIGKFYIKGSSKLKFADLQNELTTPEPMSRYMRAKTDRVLGGIFTVSSIGALVTGILVRKALQHLETYYRAQRWC
jgi:hypothetical protein